MQLFDALAARNAAGSLFTPTATRWEPRPGYPMDTGEEVGKPFDLDAALESAISASAMLWRCTVPKAEKAASVPWRVYERPKGGTGEGVPIADHPYVEPIENPATPSAFDPGEGWKARQFGRVDMMTMAHTHRTLAGRALFAMQAAADFRDPEKLIVRRMDHVDARPLFPVVDDDGAVSQWNWRDRGAKAYTAQDIIDVKRVRPGNPYQGLGVVEAIALSIDAMNEGQQLQLRRYANEGTPGMILSSEIVSKISEAEAMEDRLARRQMERRGGIMVLPSAVAAKTELVAAGLPVEQLGLLDALGLDRDLIAIGCGYLPAGFSRDAATYNNYSVFVLHEWHLVMDDNSAFADAFTRTFVPFAERDRYYIAPDYSRVEALQDVALEKLGMIKDLAFKGVALNDIIRALGAPLDPQDGGDEPLVPASVQTVAMALASEV